MPRQTWIPTKLSHWGIDFTEVPGWATRGSTTFNPQGVIGHHTANPNRSAATPSLNVITYGRKDPPLAPPLAHILIGRDTSVHLIAAGRANHAGRGGWRGLTGNTSVLGIEVENDGVGEPWSPRVYQTFVLVAAALLDGIDRDHTWFGGHREWTPRKIDPAGIDLDNMREDIRRVLAGEWQPINGGLIAPNINELNPEAIRLIQTLCAALGINPGPIDGIWGPLTQAAIEEADRRRRDGTLTAELAGLRSERDELAAQVDDLAAQLATRPGITKENLRPVIADLSDVLTRLAEVIR